MLMGDLNLKNKMVPLMRIGEEATETYMLLNINSNKSISLQKSMLTKGKFLLQISLGTNKRDFVQ